jgi:hypothetical protein
VGQPNLTEDRPDATTRIGRGTDDIRNNSLTLLYDDGRKRPINTAKSPRVEAGEVFIISAKRRQSGKVSVSLPGVTFALSCCQSERGPGGAKRSSHQFKKFMRRKQLWGQTESLVRSKRRLPESPRTGRASDWKLIG